MHTTDRLFGRGPGALAALLLASLALHAARLPAAPPDAGAVCNNVLVTVQETSTGSLLFGLGTNSDAGLTGSIVLNERNFDLLRPPASLWDLLTGAAFRGAGQELRLEPVPGTSVQRYGAAVRDK